MLRANLRYLDPDSPASSVVVTSATPGDGKSTVAWNLAAAGANAGNRTILVEAELRRPVFVREFNLPSSKGLTEVLTRGVAWREVIHRFDDGARVNGVAPRLYGHRWWPGGSRRIRWICCSRSECSI